MRSCSGGRQPAAAKMVLTRVCKRSCGMIMINPRYLVNTSQTVPRAFLEDTSPESSRFPWPPLRLGLSTPLKQFRHFRTVRCGHSTDYPTCYDRFLGTLETNRASLHDGQYVSNDHLRPGLSHCKPDT